MGCSELLARRFALGKSDLPTVTNNVISDDRLLQMQESSLRQPASHSVEIPQVIVNFSAQPRKRREAHS